MPVFNPESVYVSDRSDGLCFLDIFKIKNQTWYIYKNIILFKPDTWEVLKYWMCFQFSEKWGDAITI